VVERLRGPRLEQRGAKQNATEDAHTSHRTNKNPAEARLCKN